MKNVLLTIASVILSIVSVKAQSYYKVVVNEFYNFEFPSNMSASVALNENRHKELIGSVGRCEYIINEYTNKLTIVYDGNETNYEILGNTNGVKMSYLVIGPGFDGTMSKIMIQITESYGGTPYLLVESVVKDRPTVTRASIGEIIN